MESAGYAFMQDADKVGKMKMPLVGGRFVYPNDTLEIGEWVLIPGSRSSAIGYITDISLEDQRYKIVYVRTRKGYPLHGHMWTDMKEVVPFETKLEEDDYISLMDIALDTVDEQWFKELYAKLPADMIQN